MGASSGGEKEEEEEGAEIAGVAATEQRSVEMKLRVWRRRRELSAIAVDTAAAAFCGVRAFEEEEW